VRTSKEMGRGVERVGGGEGRERACELIPALNCPEHAFLRVSKSV